MKTLDIRQARAQLSHLVDAAAAGEEIIITKGGVPVARLGAIPANKPARKFGLLKGKIKIADDVDAPLPAEMIADFVGR